jgi:lipopolysaccharide biosynthesis glycosyltransferase
LNNIINYGKLTQNDYCISFLDEVTFNYLNTNILFISLAAKLKNFYYILYKQPVNIKEGMMKRYDIEEILKITKQIENLHPHYMYLDVDVIVLNDIRKLFTNEEILDKTKVYLVADKRFDFLDNMFFGGVVTKENEELIKSKNINLPGFSSGMFGWSNSESVLDYFNYIKIKATSIDKELYTIDQPFFNAAIFNFLFNVTNKFNFNILDNNKIKINLLVNKNTLLSESNEIVLVDYCGAPGDESLHWSKIFSQLVLQNLMT